jgi:PAS domain S-box-containing protein
VITPRYKLSYLSLLARFAIYFVSGAVAFVVAFIIFDYQNFKSDQNRLREQESLRVSLVSSVLQGDLYEVLHSLHIIATLPVLNDYILDGSDVNRVMLEQTFVNFAQYTGVYDQIRYIDKSGMERVRVNFDGQVASAVPVRQLQEKSQRYYVRESLRLKANQVYISPLDLNIENKQIERPFKPMIRFAMPVFDYAGELKGIIVINYLAARLLNDFRKFMASGQGEPMMVNPKGYWLSSPNRKNEWGFMLGNKVSFATRYSQAWNYIATHEKGEVATATGLYIFTTVRPYGLDVAPGTKPPQKQVAESYWKIITRITPQTLAYSPLPTFTARAGLLTGLFFLVAVVSAVLSWLRTDYLVKAQALRRSEEQLRELFGLASDGIFIADLEGRYTDVNNAGCNMLGYTREEIVGKSIVDLIPPEDVERLWQSKEVMLKGEAHVAEWRLRRKDGIDLPVEVSAKILPDGRWQAFLRDISERKQAEERLRQDATVFNTTMEGIIVTDAERNILNVNQAYTEITGYNLEEIVGKNPRLMQSDRQDKAFYHELWRSLNNNGHWQGEIWNRRKNGEVFPVWESISVVKDGQGRVSNYVSVMSDISSIKQTETALKTAQANLTAAQHIAQMGSWEIVLSNGAVYWSDEIYHILGRDPQIYSASYKGFLDAVHPDDRHAVEAAINESLKNCTSYIIDYRIVLPDTNVHYVQGRGSVECGQDGRAARILGTVQDVTEQTLIAQALQASQANYHNLFENMLDGYALQEALFNEKGEPYDYRYLEVNPGFERVLGLKPEQIIGKTVLEVLPHTESYWLELFGRVAVTGQPEHLEQYGHSFNRYFEIRATSPQHGQVAVFFSDITERKRAEQQLRQSREQLEDMVAQRTAALEASNKELEAFSYSIAHDLRAPLRSITSFSQILDAEVGPKLNAQERGDLQRIVKAGKYMAQLIDDILQLARISRREFTMESVNLSKVVKRIIEDLRADNPQRSVQVDIAPDINCNCDAKLLEVALRNLLENAWKYTSKRIDARIEFGVRKKGKEKLYYVRDNGVGFDMKYVHKLFTPFGRLHKPGEFEGAGIGLVSVQSAIQRHNGKVWAESKEGEGATFYFTLHAFQSNRQQSAPQKDLTVT